MSPNYGSPIVLQSPPKKKEKSMKRNIPSPIMEIKKESSSSKKRTPESSPEKDFKVNRLDTLKNEYYDCLNEKQFIKSPYHMMNAFDDFGKNREFETFEN